MYKEVEWLRVIIGKLKDLKRYFGLSKEIDEAISYVLNTDLMSLELGRYELDDNVVVNRQQYFGKTDPFAESHINFIDLQIVLKGKEKMGYADLSNPTVRVMEDYDPNIDLAKYYVTDECFYEMSADSFALIFPEDIHRPGMKVDEEMIEKVVVKIRIK